jgi:hypothetical protein
MPSMLTEPSPPIVFRKNALQCDGVLYVVNFRDVPVMRIIERMACCMSADPVLP